MVFGQQKNPQARRLEGSFVSGGDVSDKQRRVIGCLVNHFRSVIHQGFHLCEKVNVLLHREVDLK